MLCIVIIIWSLDASIYSNVIRFDLGQILIGFTKLSYQLRFDLLLLVGILPLTIALILKARQRIDIVTPVLFLITGSIFLGPIVEMFSDFYVILPYRFIPTIVFFSVGVGILFKTKNST